jgi:uncharacterized protein with PQ loop repeat
MPAAPRERLVILLGWAASAMACAMFLSYADQIRLNLDGHKGSIIQPAITVVNCLLWAAYGALKPRTDWPIVVANLPGIVFGALALVTAL